MRKFLRESGAVVTLTLLAAMLVVGGGKWLTTLATAGFNTSPVAWDTTWENDPDNTDSVSLGDDHIRQLKQELSDRLDVEHDISTQSGGTDTADTGRHREGSAVVFFQAAAPTVLDVADDDSSTALDDGRLWVDSDTNILQVYDAAWEDLQWDLNGVAAGGIIDADADTTMGGDTDDTVDFDIGGVTSAVQLVNLAAGPLTLVTFRDTVGDAGVGPTFILDRVGGSAADADLLGNILFRGRNDNASPQNVNYASIDSSIDDMTDGEEDGQLVLKTMQAGSLTAMLTMDLNFVVAAANLQITSNSIDMTTNGNRIDFDTDNDTSIRASADDTIMFEIATADDFSMTANSFNVLAGSAIDASVGALLMPNGASPSATCSVGDMFLDTDQTDDTVIATTNDNAFLICVATDTWKVMIDIA